MHLVLHASLNVFDFCVEIVVMALMNMRALLAVKTRALNKDALQGLLHCVMQS